MPGHTPVSGFKPYDWCHKSMPMSDPHSSWLKCLGEAHVWERRKIYKDFRPLTRKDRDTRLEFILMEAVLIPSSEPGHSDSAPNISASVRSALMAVWNPRRRSSSPVLRTNTLSTSRVSQHHLQCLGKSRGSLTEDTPRS